LRADIDYGFAEALTVSGKIGVKVWIFKKELFRKTDKDLLKEVKPVEREKLEDLTEVKPIEEAIIPDEHGKDEPGQDVKKVK
jgi:ribosomal protein S3